MFRVQHYLPVEKGTEFKALYILNTYSTKEVLNYYSLINKLFQNNQVKVRQGYDTASFYYQNWKLITPPKTSSFN